MRPTAEMSRSTWWAFAAGGVAALVAAGATGLAVVAPLLATGVWQLLTGILVLVAVRRSRSGVGAAFPFLGAGVAGIVFGLVGTIVPALDPRIALIAIGIWGVVAGAGYLAVAQLARANHVPDDVLHASAWIAIAAGIVISTLPVFGLWAGTLAPVGGLAVTGAISILAALRLRVLPDEAPPALSHREARRRERSGPRS